MLDTLCIGQPRLTAGLERWQRIDLTAYQTVFGQLPRLSAEQLITMAERVDLRGRGGAAFPVARKLSAVLDASRARKRAPMVVINGAEGEPGSAKDKMLLIRSPYLVLSGAMAVADALRAPLIVIGVSDPQAARSVSEAAAAEPALARKVRVMQVPDRFVSGESGALVNALNGKTALPSGQGGHASHSGLGQRPTLLSNAETFAQLAVLAMVGPNAYASAGTQAEPGTLLLTVGGAAARPAVVEVPSGLPLGHVLDLCGADPGEGILVGGYHGGWLPGEAAWDVPASRAGLAAAGGTLGAGVVLALRPGTCPLSEVARVAAYLAKESSGQCGPCKLGLPGIARSLAALAAGSGGLEALATARRGAAAVRGQGACRHPEGVSRFVWSALEVFSDDIAAHAFRGGCNRPAGDVLPVPAAAGETKLALDWTRCRGHGLCAHIVPELVQLNGQGFPVMLDTPVPPWLQRDAQQAVAMCPALALRLVPAGPAPTRRGVLARTLSAGHDPVADTVPDLAVSEEWIAQIADLTGDSRGRQLVPRRQSTHQGS
jgi:NADH:ubiquinone oxidoreductase subunit F (NADH-binding)/ferredoxin